MPLADWPVALRNFIAARSADSSCARTIGQQRAADHLLRRLDRGRRRPGPMLLPPGWRAADHGADAEQQRDDRGGLRIGELLAQAREMPARHVAGLVRQHADDLVRRLGIVERADVDEDAPAVHHERVERALVDQHDLHVLLRRGRRRLQDRRGVVAHQLLDLGVADDRQAAGGRSAARMPAGRRARSATAVAARWRATLASRGAPC